MNILLTGGAGYIGSHTAVELISRGHNVIIVDNYSNSSPSMIERIGQITGQTPSAYNADICDLDALEHVFSAQQIDAVAHFAGLKAVGESVEQPLRYYQNNVGSTITLLKAMARHSVSRLIFSSSATVYGEPKALPYTEDMGTIPPNPYGWTKLMSEQVIRDYAAATVGFSAVLLRYFNPVGAHQSGLIGENPRGVPNNLMPYLCQVPVGKREALNIFGNDYPTADGTGVRDYIHVVDLAKGHAAALDFCLNHTGVEVFNLGTGSGKSVLEVVEAFEKANCLHVPCRIAPRRPGDLPIYYADSSKANRMLGWQAVLSLEDMCRDAWRWQQNAPDAEAEDRP